MFDNNSLFPLLLSTIAGLSTVLGAIIIFFTKSRNEKFLTFALGFSAGVMIAVSFTDLFPTAQTAISKYHGNTPGVLWSILFMLIGAIMAYLIDLLIPEGNSNKIAQYDNNFDIFRVGLVSTIALMIHNFPEGIATFVSGYQDTTLGITVTLAIALHNIPEGIAIAMPIYFASKSRAKALKYSFISGMAEPFGALIAFICLKPFINDLILGIIFAVVCGIMLYISFAELIPSSQKYGYSKIALISIFLGFSVMPLTHIFV